MMLCDHKTILHFEHHDSKTEMLLVEMTREHLLWAADSPITCA